MQQRFCEILSSQRKKIGMSRQELSNLTGISKVSLYAYETGKCLPHVNNLFKLSDALKLDYDEMYNILLKEKECRKN